jgi:RNA polymerase sigma-70 factor (ECF subfamily)
MDQRVPTLAPTSSGAPPDEDPLAAVVRAAARGDRSAWTRLYDRFAPIIHGLLLLSVRREQAEDLTQDVFLRAMARLKDLREPAAIGAWLCAIARNEAATWARGKGRMEQHLTKLASERVSGLAEAGSADQPLMGGQAPAPLDGEQVLDHVRTLPEAYRETLVLRMVCGLTGPQIAAATGMTEGSVRVNLFRGMALLREALGIEKNATGAVGGGA